MDDALLAAIGQLAMDEEKGQPVLGQFGELGVVRHPAEAELGGEGREGVGAHIIGCESNRAAIGEHIGGGRQYHGLSPPRKACSRRPIQPAEIV
jgi:hypothetical protein